MNFWVIEIYKKEDTGKLDYAPWSNGETKEKAISSFIYNEFITSGIVGSFILIQVSKELEDEFMNGYYPFFVVKHKQDSDSLGQTLYLDFPNDMEQILKTLQSPELDITETILKGMPHGHLHKNKIVGKIDE